MSWPFYLALKQLFPTGRRLTFFTFMSLAGVALGVAALVVTLSVMGGFGQEIRRMMVDIGGEVQIKSGGAIANPGEIVARARQVPGVVGATPYAQGVVMLLMDNRPAFPAIQGIDLEHVEEVVPLQRYIRWGRLADLDDDSVILSASLAQSLGTSVGGKIELYTPLMLERMRKDEVILPREFRVVGLFEIGHAQLDSNLVICTLRTMQDLYGMGRSVHGIDLRLRPGTDEDAVAAELNAVLPANLRALTWMDTNRDFLFILRVEKTMLLFLLLFIEVVAGFLIASSLVTTVVRKTREIGLLSALGGDAWSIARCFCYQGLFVGLFGTGLGLALGFAAVAVRNDAVQLFARLTQSRAALQRFYMFTELPAHLEGADFAIIVLCSIAIATLASVLAAWIAARLKPAEALRSE